MPGFQVLSEKLYLTVIHGLRDTEGCCCPGQPLLFLRQCLAMPWSAHLCLSSSRTWPHGKLLIESCLLAFGASEHRVPNPTKRLCHDLSQFAGSYPLIMAQQCRRVANTANRHPDTWIQASVATVTPAQCNSRTAVMLSFCAAVLNFRSDAAGRLAGFIPLYPLCPIQAVRPRSSQCLHWAYTPAHRGIARRGQPKVRTHQHGVPPTCWEGNDPKQEPWPSTNGHEVLPEPL